jgi:S-adenosylmethionine:diacylglycerol 3-amino-3-carboxypropyl transferase
VKSETAWQAGRLGSVKGPQRLLFGRMYEDVEIDRAAFAGKRRVFCIASAGSTAISLAEDREVVACDINPVQLAYARRRADGAPEETGDAERVMKFARLFMPLVGWRESVLRSFLALSDVEAQMAFWRERLDTLRFRLGFDALLSRPVLRLAYAPGFLSVAPPGFGSVLRGRLERGFARHPNATNPYARSLLLGESAVESRRKRSEIQFVLADAASCLESRPSASFEGFTLSNILDGAEPSYRSRLTRAIRHAATPDAVVVTRSFAEPAVGVGQNLAEQDRSMLWGIVEVRPAATL